EALLALRAREEASARSALLLRARVAEGKAQYEQRRAIADAKKSSLRTLNNNLEGIKRLDPRERLVTFNPPSRPLPSGALASTDDFDSFSKSADKEANAKKNRESFESALSKLEEGRTPEETLQYLKARPAEIEALLLILDMPSQDDFDF